MTVNNARKKHAISAEKRKQDKLSQVSEIVPAVEENIETVRPSSRKKKMLKLGFVAGFVIAVLAGIYLVGLEIYISLAGPTNKIVISEKAEKATTEKVFTMNDIIEYNGVDYKIVKIETSKGNSYKSPKAGHQFLIVTVYIKNHSEKKIPYSYENWTMSNSKGEEKRRIFSSINVDTALYSGELVIGGIKTGSMVFEQPINDPKLKMNFYELKKDKDGNEVIDQAKRVFSVSVKITDKNKKDTATDKSNDNMKLVKTSTKNKS